MIPDLGCIIIDTALSFLNDSFQIRFFKSGAGNECIQVINISLMMLTIVIIKRLFTYKRDKSIKLLR